ncbi:Endonuclease/exonuclease/phosphatase, partial [Mycena belliarum]
MNAQNRGRPKPPVRKRIRKRTKGWIKVATLNMRGRYHLGQDKWLRINQIMRDKKIGILATQETHLSQDEAENINKIFEKRLQVFASIDPDHPNAKGVAIVINKEISNIQGIKTEELVPGRALHMTIPWHGESKLTIVAAYAPNDPVENATFLDILELKMRSRPKPEIVLGDFNMVEDAIDRLPHHKDPNIVTEAMLNLKAKLHLQDGWRQTYPDTKGYTFLQPATGSQSRIDRILVTDNILRNSLDWRFESSGLHTDHQLLSMKYADPKMPFIGKGRWVLPLHLLKDKTVMDKVYALGKETEARLEAAKINRTAEENPQTIFKQFKDQIGSLFRDRAKVVIPKMEQEIKEMNKKLNNILNNPNMGEEERKTESAALQAKIDATERTRNAKIRDNTAARVRLEGESTATKFWTSMNKEKKPRDTTSSLQIPGSDPPVYETRSDKMAELARDFHDNLQSEGLVSPAEQEEAETTALKNIKRLSQQNKAKLSQYLKRAEVARVLHRLPNGKAPGIDGIVHELWKALHKNYEGSKNQDEKPMDIAKILTDVYNDIEEHGTHPETDFAEGWMCLLHKKNDKRNVSNYRPITLLNTDYKIFTKALSIKL